jgi:transcriptional regulatory protein LEU3
MRILPPTLYVRLRQEKAADRIGRQLYSTHPDRTDEESIMYLNMQAERLKSERKSVDGVDNGMPARCYPIQITDPPPELEELYHRAVSVHTHLHSFFIADPRLERREDLVALYFAATGFLDRVFKLHRENKLLFVPYYIMQMSLAAGFALLKILNSDFASRLPSDQGRKYVLQTVDVLRKSKVWPNDLLDRFAEVLAQLWKESSRGRSLHSQSPSISNAGMATFTHNAQPQPHQSQNPPQIQRRDSSGLHDDMLGLIVRSRKSMSVVFDCVWRWREAQVSGAADQLDSTVITNPTNPDSSSNSTPPPGMLVENLAHGLPTFNPHLNTLSEPLALPQGLASANSFEFFDSVSWMLDTQNDWNQYPTSGFGTDFGA